MSCDQTQSQEHGNEVAGVPARNDKLQAPFKIHVNTNRWRFQGVFIFNLVKHEPLVYNKVYEYPVWGQGIGWAMAVASMICIPTGMAVQLLRTEGTFVEVQNIRVGSHLQDMHKDNHKYRKSKSK